MPTDYREIHVERDDDSFYIQWDAHQQEMMVAYRPEGVTVAALADVLGNMTMRGYEPLMRYFDSAWDRDVIVLGPAGVGG